MSGKFAYLQECLLVCLYLTLADMFLFGFLENTGELNSSPQVWLVYPGVT